MTELKPLPRDSSGQLLREFKANGKKYIIRSGSEPMSIRRFNEYEKMSLSLGFTATFSDQFKNNKKAMNLANGVVSGENTFTDLVMHLNAMNEGMLSASEQRNNMALYFCSIFIVREDEDLTKWNKAEADHKIEDWNKEYDVSDFLALGLRSIPSFTNVVKELKEKIAQKIA